MSTVGSMLWGLIRLYTYLVPLAAAVSVVYGATRHERWPAILRHSARLFSMILGFMLLSTLVLCAITN